MFFKSDQELVFLALLDATKLQREEAVRFRKEEKTVGEPPIAEELPVGEHQSNGESERTGPTCAGTGGDTQVGSAIDVHKKNQN